MNITERLLVATKATGLRNKDIAEYCKVTPAAVTQWLDGSSTPKSENIFNLADLSGFSARWLAIGDGEVALSENPKIPYEIRRLIRLGQAGNLDDKAIKLIGALADLLDGQTR